MNPFTQTKLSTSKLEMNEMKALLPLEIREGLENGTLKMVDAVIYSSKALDNATSKELMAASDNQKEGITNLNNRKLEAVQYFMLKGIRLRSASISGEAAITEQNIAEADFSKEIDPKVANGELEILVSGKTAFPRNSCSVFQTNNSVALAGYHELDCPRLIAPQSEIVPTLRTYGSTGGRVVVHIELFGCKIIPA